jgi:hypothetical protein
MAGNESKKVVQLSLVSADRDNVELGLTRAIRSDICAVPSEYDAGGVCMPSGKCELWGRCMVKPMDAGENGERGVRPFKESKTT